MADRPYRIVLVLCLVALVMGAWELIVTRMASVYFFTGITHLVLALSLLGFSIGALIARRYPDTHLMWLMAGLCFGLPLPSWWLLTATNAAWIGGLFLLPFIAFGAASTFAWQQLETRRHRTILYCGESIATVGGLVLAGPLMLAVLPIDTTGSVGITNHVRTLLQEETLVDHQQYRSLYATTDRIQTSRSSVVYFFTDARFVTRAVAWDGVSDTFADSHLESLATLKRLAHATSVNRDVLLLGAGAGFDIAIALQAGSANIDAVEINPRTLELARQLDDWSGGVMSHPRVTLHVAEARRFVAGEDRRWHHINLTLLQTSPASGRGYSHVDGRVLTREAIKTYLNHLHPDGVLTIIQNTPMLATRTRDTVLSVVDDPAQLSRWYLAPDSHQPNPFNQLLVVHKDPAATGPRYENAAAIAGVARYQDAETPRTDNLIATTDDHPFLFGSTFQTLIHAVISGALALLATFALLLREKDNRGHGRLMMAALLTGAVVLAFQVLVIYYCQAALGAPVLALSIALGACIGGAGLGAILLGASDQMKQWKAAGLAAAAGCLAFSLSAGTLVNGAMGMSLVNAVVLTMCWVTACSLPLGLPFLAIMEEVKSHHNNAEGLVLAADGLGGVLGAAIAGACTLMAGFNSLAAVTIASLAVFAFLMSKRPD